MRDEKLEIFLIKNFKDYIHSLNEGLIKTYDGDKILKEVLYSLKMASINIDGFYDSEKNIIEIELGDVYRLNIEFIHIIFDTLTSYMTNIGGWFPGGVKFHFLSGFESKKPYNYSQIVKNIPNVEKLIIYYGSNFSTDGEIRTHD